MTRSDVRTWVTISRSEEPGEAAPRRRSAPVTFSNAVQYPNGSETSGASAAPANITPSEPRKVSMSATKRLVVISDLHSGCRLGLCPSGGVPLDDGGMYLPSDLQLKLWSMWREFWDDFVPTVTGGKPWALVVTGDAIDGVHHGSTTPVSHPLLDPVRIASQWWPARPGTTTCVAPRRMPGRVAGSRSSWPSRSGPSRASRVNRRGTSCGRRSARISSTWLTTSSRVSDRRPRVRTGNCNQCSPSRPDGGGDLPT